MLCVFAKIDTSRREKPRGCDGDPVGGDAAGMPLVYGTGALAVLLMVVRKRFLFLGVLFLTPGSKML